MATLPKLSFAVTVRLPNETPAVAFAGPLTVNVAAATGATVIEPVVPVIVPVTVSVAVTVWPPAWVSVALKVWVPLSPATKV